MKKVDEEQSGVWIKSEADNWFLRNKNQLGKKRDIITLLLELYRLQPKKAVEIGCSNGYRLAAIHKKYGAAVIGVEPSKKAIAAGKTRWPFIKFINAMGESFKIREKADLVIVNFVFYWVDRKNLMKFITKIDELLAPGGFIILGDFGLANFVKRKYHHLPKAGVFTYKQQYQNIFTASGSYKEIAKICFNHDTGEISADIDNHNTGTISLLKKIELYQEV